MATLDKLIRERAYLLWVEEGRPCGRDYHHWTAAAGQVQAEEPKAPAAPRYKRGGAPKKHARSSKEAAARYCAFLENQGRKSFHQHVLLALRSRKVAESGKRKTARFG